MVVLVILLKKYIRVLRKKIKIFYTGIQSVTRRKKATYDRRTTTAEKKRARPDPLPIEPITTIVTGRDRTGQRVVSVYNQPPQTIHACRITHRSTCVLYNAGARPQVALVFLSSGLIHQCLVSLVSL